MYKRQIQCARLAFGYGGIYDQDEAERIVEEKVVSGEVVLDEPKPLPKYPADQFDKNMPAWGKMIQEGKKTAEAIIATVSTRYTMTEAQVEAIKDVAEPATPEPMTFAQVNEALQSAGDLDTLDLKADLINRVADAGQREELSAIYHGLRAKMED